MQIVRYEGTEENIHPPGLVAAAAFTEPYLLPTTTNATSRQRTIPCRVLIRSCCDGMLWLRIHWLILQHAIPAPRSPQADKPLYPTIHGHPLERILSQHQQRL